ncbi:unnamed protein product [Candida parapsilosis]|nr:Uncharacterized protein K4G60_g2749 [Candida parapsilosis]KAI5907931.1 hypothetical protein K4G61_g1603 [Candida parapsilosis]CAD1808670.1 unnamed protein product [Candida parapsilosis]
MSKLGPIFRRIAMRRSRAVLLLFIIFVTHILVASHIHDTPIKQYLAETVPIPHLKQLLLTAEKEQNATDFDSLVVEYMQKQSSLTGTSLSSSMEGAVDENTQHRIDVTKQVMDGTTYTTNDQFYVINIPPKEQLPAFQNYDPRYTFGLLLKHINTNLNNFDQQQQPHLTIPVFHWSDYVDMSAMEEFLFNPEKQPCQYFDSSSRNPKKNEREGLLKPETYCVNDDDIDAILKDSQAQEKYNADTIAAFQRIQRERDNSPFLTTGFHIYSVTGRNKKSARPILSRSYLYDFMQVPLTLTFLLPGEKSIQIDVNQAQEERITLKDSSVFQDGEINVKNEIVSLSNKLPKRGDQELSMEKHLTHDQFIDHSAERVSFLESQTPQLNQTDKNYLQALKTSLQEQDPTKYFHEAYIVRREANYASGSHYDWRFMNGIVNGTPRQGISINGLLKAFLRLTNQYNLNTWIAHGSLLSWYWNGLQFPWDADVDVQMPIDDLHRLTRLFNQTIVVDFGTNLQRETRFGRYFLDSSTFISHRSRGNGRNNIDARFIDLDTGLYIDITGLAVSDMPTPGRYNFLLTKTKYASFHKNDVKSIHPIEKNNYLQIYNCRNAHFAKLQEISPLRLNSVQGEIGYIPYDFETMLHVEYRAKGTSSTLFADHVYLPKLRIWVPKIVVLKYVTNGGLNNGEGRLQRISEGDTDMIIVTLSDGEYIDFLYDNEPVLRNFIATHEITLVHTIELRKLVKSKTSLKMFLKENAGKYGFGRDSDAEANNGGGGGLAVLLDASPSGIDKRRASLQLDYFVDKVRNTDGGYDYNAELMKLNDRIKLYSAALKNRREPGVIDKLKNEFLSSKKEEKVNKRVNDKESKKNKKSKKKKKQRKLMD